MELYALQLLPGSPWVLSSIFNLLSQRSLEPRLRRRRKMSYQCYANNGSLYENTPATYVPCNLTAVENGAHSSCCNVNDLCMTNGLCMEAQNEKKGANHYWRNGCTDPTFKDPACPNFCRGKEEPDHYNAFIFYCFSPKNEFCCTPQGTIEAGVTGRNTSCCNDEDLVFTAKPPEVFATAVVALPRASTSRSSSSKAPEPTSSSVSQSQQESSIASAASVPTTSSTESSSSSAGMSTGAKAGLGVGITLGVLAILGIVGAVFFLKRRKSNVYDGAVLLSDSKANPPPYVTYESAGTVRAELEGTMLPAEMHNASGKMSDTTATANEVSPNLQMKEGSLIQKYT